MKKLLRNILLATFLSSSLQAGMGDNPLYTKVTIDQLEYRQNGEKSLSWDSNIWIGYDLNKLYLYTEGEKPNKDKATTENQLLYSRAIAPFWDIQFGFGYDKNIDASQKWGVIALQGLAPYFFETRGALLFGEGGNLGLRLDLEYEALLTQKLILTPSFSADLYSKDNSNMQIGKGLSNITTGVRLRYEIKREFAPYIGFEWSKNFGNSNKLSPVNESYLVGGVRVWF